MVRVFIGIIAILTINFSVFADLCRESESFFYDGHRGWFYGEYCEPKKDKPITEKKKKELNIAVKQLENVMEDKKDKKNEPELKFLPDKKVKIPWDILDELDPDTISEIEQRSRKIAIMHPTYENVKEYMYLQKYMTDKSWAYSETFQVVTQTDPVLAGTGGAIESTKFARDVMFSVENEKQDEKLKSYARDKAGLVMFYKTGCPYCAQEKRMFDSLKEKYGFQYELINIDTNPALAQKFQVSTVPDMFIVFRDKNDEPVWRRLGIGLHTLPELKEVIYFSIQGYESGGGYINGTASLY